MSILSSKTKSAFPNSDELKLAISSSLGSGKRSWLPLLFLCKHVQWWLRPRDRPTTVVCQVSENVLIAAARVESTGEHAKIRSNEAWMDRVDEFASRPLGENQWRLFLSTHAHSRSIIDHVRIISLIIIMRWSLSSRVPAENLWSSPMMAMPEALRLYRAILRRARQLKYTDKGYFRSLMRKEFEKGRKIDDTKFQIQVHVDTLTRFIDWMIITFIVFRKQDTF